MKNHDTSTNRIEVKESKSEMLKLCRYGYGNFKKQKTIIPSNNMILNTTVQIFRLLLTRKYVCQLVPINCDFSGPAERVRLMTCRLIGNYPDREFNHYYSPRTRISCGTTWEPTSASSASPCTTTRPPTWLTHRC